MALLGNLAAHPGFSAAREQPRSERAGRRRLQRYCGRTGSLRGPWTVQPGSGTASTRKAPPKPCSSPAPGSNKAPSPTAGRLRQRGNEAVRQALHWGSRGGAGQSPPVLREAEARSTRREQAAPREGRRLQAAWVCPRGFCSGAVRCGPRWAGAGPGAALPGPGRAGRWVLKQERAKELFGDMDCGGV